MRLCSCSTNYVCITCRNTEEESKMNDELKVYTGKETIEALLEGKTLKHEWNNHHYKIVGDKLLSGLGGGNFDEAAIVFSNLMESDFTEVATPQVGDWVKVTYKSTNNTFVHTAQVNNIEDGKMWADWEGLRRETFYRISQEGVSWEILSPEQVPEYKRELAFSKVGRKLNEFKSGDIVMIDCLNTVAIVISKKNEANSIIKLHGINEVGKGYDASAHQLTPICFAENQVDLS